MKIHKNKKHNKKWPMYAVVSAVICIIILSYWLISHQVSWWPFASTQQIHQDQPSTPVLHEQQTTTNNNDGDSTQQNETPPTDKTPVKYSSPTGGAGSDSNDLTGIINYKQVIDDQLVIRVTINQLISTGTCTLTLSNNGITKKYTSDITSTPTAATCNGFSIPVTDLGSGKWIIDITLTSGNRSGNISSSVEV